MPRTDFSPDYRHVLSAARSQRPTRLPVYEHNISVSKMEEITGKRFAALHGGSYRDKVEYFTQYGAFFRQTGYDTVTFEACITDVVQRGECLSGHVPGIIRNRADEIVQDFTGYSALCMLRVDDPPLYAELFRAVGDLMVSIWARFLSEFGNLFAVCRFGDDLGFKSSTLLVPEDIRGPIIPQYRRIVDLVHDAGKPFLLHCCGNIFDVMDDIISGARIDAKHSNEDQIAPFPVWVEAAAGYLAMVNAVREYRGDFR